MSYDPEHLQELIKEGDINSIKDYMKKYDLVIYDKKIMPRDSESYEKDAEYYDRLQHTRKILLNSLYGALLNPYCRVYDERIGKSVTLTGRMIARHQAAKLNELILGKYDYKGEAVIYCDTDSVASDSVVRILIDGKEKQITIAELYDITTQKFLRGEKEYGFDETIQSMTYDTKLKKELYKSIDYVYRHKVSKSRYRVTTADGDSITVTGDHAIMVERDGVLVEAKPTELHIDDIIIKIDQNSRMIVKSRIAKIEKLDDFQNEYVYDIGINKETPYFFANNILVHNSAYISAYPFMKNEPDYQNLFVDLETTKVKFAELYNLLAEELNKTFPEFLESHFNTPRNHCVIKSGRELVGSKALFITKKRYATLMYDKENVRLDVDGEPGKIKVMGLDLKRSDTPEKVQDFLEDILTDVLTGQSSSDVMTKIKTFRKEFRSWPAWEKGSPRRTNALTRYGEKDAAARNTDRHIELNQRLASAKTPKEVAHIKKEIEQLKKVTIPGHVNAALNWNKLRRMNNDALSREIHDGDKVIVCKLRSNIWKMTSIAYPVDESHLPDWFKQLPFDSEAMETTVLDNKLENLLSVLNWGVIENSKEDDTDALFDFGG